MKNKNLISILIVGIFAIASGPGISIATSVNKDVTEASNSTIDSENISTVSLVTCINLVTGKERISRTGLCRTSQEAIANWHLTPTDSTVTPGSTTKFLTVCSNRENSTTPYQIIRAKCARHMSSNLYSRTSAIPSTPVIISVASDSHESAIITIAQDSANGTDSPISHYTITTNSGEVQRVFSWRELTLIASGLRSSTSYTFTIAATNADGTSVISNSSLPVTTRVYVPPTPPSNSSTASPSTPLAAPLFTLSSVRETSTINVAAVGFTINSTGGAIASFAISGTPAGMTFNTSTGTLSGIPTTLESAMTYTVTATNAAGSATQTFTQSVVYTLGQVGPGGGKIFYVSASSFACGPTRNLTCQYLEVAPVAGLIPGNLYGWSGNTNTGLTTNSTVIGSGYQNTLEMINQSPISSKAGTFAHAFRGNDLTDWYLPSKDELNQLCKWQGNNPWVSDATVCSGGGPYNYPDPNDLTTGFNALGFENFYYWSSSQSSATNAWRQDFDSGGQENRGKNNGYYAIPIRAF